MKKVRLSDIAEATGVSTVTVHNALNGQKGVSGSLRERIQRVADEMGYENPKKDKKEENEIWEFQRIGVLIWEKYLGYQTPYYWKIYQELALVATEKKCFTILETLSMEGDAEVWEMPQMVLHNKNKVEGIIIIGEMNKQYISKMKKMISVPFVFLDFYSSDFNQDAVVADNFYGMYQMTELLFSNGIEDIGFIGSVHVASSIMDRYCGFMRSMMEHKKNIHPEWLIEDREETGGVKFELPKCLPEAFVCNSDLVAGMLVNKVNERGLKVPDDISVVGFDNFMYPEYSDIKITTYEVSTKAMAEIAVNKLLRQIRHPGISGGIEVVCGNVVMKNSIRRKKTE